MKHKQIVLILIVIAAAACGKIKPIAFKSIEGFKANTLGLSSSSLKTTLLFNNPNKFAISFKRLQGNVAINGKDIGECLADTALKVAANSDFILPVTIQLKSVASLLSGFMFIGQDSVLVHFKGVARVGRSGFFINYKFDTENKVGLK